MAKKGMEQMIKELDKGYQGSGPNPYKYPVFSIVGAIRLTEIIRENNRMSQNIALQQPIFAAHSAMDQDALYRGIAYLFKNQGSHRMSILIGEQSNVMHAEIVLDADIPMQEPFESDTMMPKANPNFKGMMKLVMSFFENYVQTSTSS